MRCWDHFLMWRIPDYIMIVVIVIVAAIVGAKVRPHCRPFSWDDATIGYQHKKDTFPMYSVAIAVVLVALVYVAGELLTRWRRPLTPGYQRRRGVGWIRSMLLHLNGWILVQAYSILLAFAIVNISKVYAGRLRPDFLARLTAEGFANDGTFDSLVASGPICDAAREGRLSFPSGHSGTAFSGFVPPVLYLFGLTRQLYKGNSYFIVTLCLLPLILPITVAISRTGDNRHNFDDILCGSLVGTACGLFAVFFSFRAADTGEWTLRSHPVDERDYGDADGEGDEGGCSRIVDDDSTGTRSSSTTAEANPISPASPLNRGHSNLHSSCEHPSPQQHQPRAEYPSESGHGGGTYNARHQPESTTLGGHSRGRSPSTKDTDGAEVEVEMVARKNSGQSKSSRAAWS